MGGFHSVYTRNRKQSQMMMRARVFFQFLTVTSLVGSIYYREVSGTTVNRAAAQAAKDSRVYLVDPREYATLGEEAAAREAGEPAAEQLK